MKAYRGIGGKAAHILDLAFINELSHFTFLCTNVTQVFEHTVLRKMFGPEN